jgi:hypothetical protein
MADTRKKSNDDGVKGNAKRTRKKYEKPAAAVRASSASPAFELSVRARPREGLSGRIGRYSAGHPKLRWQPPLR